MTGGLFAVKSGRDRRTEGRGTWPGCSVFPMIDGADPMSKGDAGRSPEAWFMSSQGKAPQGASSSSAGIIRARRENRKMDDGHLSPRLGQRSRPSTRLPAARQ